MKPHPLLTKLMCVLNRDAQTPNPRATTRQRADEIQQPGGRNSINSVNPDARPDR
jgi:hypothetical protein